MNETIENICTKYQIHLDAFVNELREAGVDPSPNYFGEGSNSFTIIAGGVPFTIGKLEHSEFIKEKLSRLKKLEDYIQDKGELS